MADTYQVKSDYTILRKKARQSLKGDIYENNLMTITPIEILLPEGQNLVHSDSNFKFSIRIDNNLKKRHSKDNWLKNENGTDTWTLDDIIESPLSSESEIRIKPDYSSLRDFAYYGSAVEMVHATVNHVLMHFPGELYFSTDKFEPTNRKGERIDIGTYYKVYNECEINVDADLIDESKIENPIRYLCLSIGEYEKIKDGEVIEDNLTRGNFNRNPNFCDEGILGTVVVGGIEITVYVMAGQKFLLHKNMTNKGISIRPNNTIITQYFATIDDFESVLLNRDTNPVYKATFETTLEKEDGYYYTMEPYVWPSINDWTPDMHSAAYQSYIMRLISLAEYHDEFDSNNIWRMMTHESIKNLDWTFFRENGDSMEDMSNIDSSRIEAIVQLYGRQYDGLKRYIDNIKHVNKVTYDQKNNIPDYLLTDTVEMSGFDALLPNPTAKTSVETYGPLYPGLSKGYSEVDGNTFFMRNLKLNAPYLNSVKGTREGIKAMLALLGFAENEYEITEYVTIAQGSGNSTYCRMDSEAIFGIPEDEAQRSDSCKYPAAIDVEMINVNKDTYPINDVYSDGYHGIGCKPVEVYTSSGTIDYRYVIPWYENGKYYEGDWYFQCDGGWGKRETLDVSDLMIMGNYLGITELSGDTLYDETESRLKFAETLDEMLNLYPKNLENGDICYITDISDLTTIQNGIYSDITEDPLSHYFVINDKVNYCLLGENGWSYIPLTDILSSDPSAAAQKVIYLESIKDSTFGNNPHVAKRDYDNGKRYVDCLDDIFKYSLETSGFSYFSDTDVTEAIPTYKFNIDREYKPDNRKAEYFKPQEQSDLKILDGSTQAPLRNVDDFCCEETSGYTIVNPENNSEDAVYFEPAANSIINLKNIEIGFHQPDMDDSWFIEQWNEYLNNIVLNYVKQMIPSTAILSIKLLEPIENECLGGLTVVPTSIYFTTQGGTDVITVTAKKQGWTIIRKPDWLELSQTSGEEGTTEVTLTCESYNGNTERTGTIVVKGTQFGQKTVQVAQAGAQPVFSYKLECRTVGKPTDKKYDVPTYIKAYFQTYNSRVQKESTLVSEEDVTTSCTWSAYNSKTGICAKAPIRTNGEFTQYEGSSAWMIKYNDVAEDCLKDYPMGKDTKCYGDLKIFACPMDNWKATYRGPDGKDYNCYSTVRVQPNIAHKQW